MSVVLVSWLLAFSFESPVAAEPAGILEQARKAEENQAKQNRSEGNDETDRIDPAQFKSGAKSIYAGTSILLGDGNWTLVPANSILCVPESQQSRVSKERQGEYLGWSQFYRKNVSWLATQPVSLKTITGEDPLDDSVKDRLTSMKKIVVATYQKNPVSVLNSNQEEKINE